MKKYLFFQYRKYLNSIASSVRSGYGKEHTVVIHQIIKSNDIIRVMLIARVRRSVHGVLDLSGKGVASTPRSSLGEAPRGRGSVARRRRRRHSPSEASK